MEVSFSGKLKPAEREASILPVVHAPCPYSLNIGNRMHPFGGDEDATIHCAPAYLIISWYWWHNLTELSLCKSVIYTWSVCYMVCFDSEMGSRFWWDAEKLEVSVMVSQFQAAMLYCTFCPSCSSVRLSLSSDWKLYLYTVLTMISMHKTKDFSCISSCAHHASRTCHPE